MEFWKEKLVYENDVAKFFTTTITNSLTQWAIKPDMFDICLSGWSVLLAESIIYGGRSYVLINPDGEVVKESTTMEGMACIIDIIKVSERI